MDKHIIDRLTSQEFAEKIVDTFSRLQTMHLISFDQWWKVIQETMQRELNVYSEKK